MIYSDNLQCLGNFNTMLHIQFKVTKQYNLHDCTIMQARKGRGSFLDNNRDQFNQAGRKTTAVTSPVYCIFVSEPSRGETRSSTLMQLCEISGLSVHARYCSLIQQPSHLAFFLSKPNYTIFFPVSAFLTTALTARIVYVQSPLKNTSHTNLLLSRPQ